MTYSDLKTKLFCQISLWGLPYVFCNADSIDSIGHLRSFGGHLVTQNSNIIGTIDSALKKTYEKAYNMPQSEIWYESYVYGSLLVTWGHLEVIWRSFGDSKHKSDVCNRLRVPKNLGKDM